jgi:NAD(P)-dependent dehydrogenase (short-subunit alcohol dehydrogenase family)
MDLQLKGQLALVTGSTLGIGKGIAQTLLKEGARVVINGHSEERLDSVREEMLSYGDAYFIKADVTKTDEVNSLIEQIYELGELDIVVNNVGWWDEREFVDITDEEWTKMMDVNFYSAVRVCRACLPAMMKRNYGRIVNISSEVAYKPSPNMLHYAVAKTAVVSLSRGLAQIAKESNVCINSLLPGPAWTPGEADYQIKTAEKLGKDLDIYISEFFEEYEPTSIQRRFLDVDEIANAVAFYVSPLASGATGASIRIDGGIVKFL